MVPIVELRGSMGLALSDSFMGQAIPFWIALPLCVIGNMIPVPFIYFFARKVLKLDILNTLGSICGGMTSTPALGALMSMAKTEAVASAYAATYPLALIMVVLCCQFIPILFG